MKIFTKLNKFWKQLILSEKITLLSAIILPFCLFVYSEIRNYVKDADIEKLQYQLNALQYHPRLAIISGPHFTSIEMEPLKITDKQISEAYSSNQKSDTLDLGLTIIIKRINSNLEVVNVGNSLGKIITCVATSKYSDVDFIRDVLLDRKTDENIKNYIKTFPFLFQNEILSYRDTLVINFTHEIFSKDLSEKKIRCLSLFDPI